MTPRPGPRNLITDVAGVSVGNAEDHGVRSGVSVVLFDSLIPAAVDVRGGAPGTRETDVLRAENLVGRAHGIVLSGGSVFGLGAADGVVAWLSARDRGLRLHEGTPAIPIIPAAVLYDLANGGTKDWGARNREGSPPYHTLGQRAAAASSDRFSLGACGAGLGARAGQVAGGLGSASLDLGDGLMVGALVAVNAVGSVYLSDARTFWAWPFEIDGEFGGQRPEPGMPAAIDPLPDASKLGASHRFQPGANTTLALVATSADLSTAECQRMAIMAQDGLARAIRPAHTGFDGDVVFAAATGQTTIGQTTIGQTTIGQAATGGDMARAIALTRIGSAAADCLSRAIARGVHAALQPGDSGPV